MKNIGISDEVYSALLHYKHFLEKSENRIFSYDEVIKKLIENNGGKKGGTD